MCFVPQLCFEYRNSEPNQFQGQSGEHLVIFTLLKTCSVTVLLPIHSPHNPGADGDPQKELL